jgi:hypothetical protein
LAHLFARVTFPHAGAVADGLHPDGRSALANLRDPGLVGVLSLGELEGHQTRAAACWRLTDDGREELARTS